MAVREHKWSKAASGAVLAVSCGLALWQMPLGEPWINASYDYLFRFCSRMPTNQVVILLMDNESYDFYHVSRDDRDNPWKRALHAELLNLLADEGCPLAVFDVFFGQERERQEEQNLAAALSRQQ